MLLCQQGQGKVLYRYALAIACAADGDEMPIKKPEFDECIDSLEVRKKPG